MRLGAHAVARRLLRLSSERVVREDPTLLVADREADDAGVPVQARIGLAQGVASTAGLPAVVDCAPPPVQHVPRAESGLEAEHVVQGGPGARHGSGGSGSGGRAAARLRQSSSVSARLTPFVSFRR